MCHRNAPLTETGRLRLARCVVEDGWVLRRAAERFQVSVTCAKRWADRYRVDGEAGMVDRSSRPWHSYNIARLTHLDRATGRVVRRYERARPGELVHVDIKKLGNIPDGGGHRTVGRQAGKRHRTRTPGKTLDRNGGSHVGYSYLHNAVDDHSRLACSEILPDERKETAVAFWRRAQAFFNTYGITVERVLTDNGACYISRVWKDALAGAGITHKRTRPYRPQTNGKVERYNRTLQIEWAYRQAFLNNDDRAAALAPWLEHYNTQRRHTALGGLPPISRL